jgi:hypothetical protein
MKIKNLLCLFLLIFNPIEAQNFNYILSDTKNFFVTGENYFTSPLHFDKTDWLTLSSVVGATGVGFLVDNTVKSFTLKNKSSFNDALF